MLLAAGAWLAPLVVPGLPVDQFIRYMNKLPIKVPRTEHSHERVALPQHYADQFGWDEMVSGVAAAWNKIPPAERKDCSIFAQDYGQAGAIDFLPPALSGHQTWWLWGPRGYSGNCVIVLDDTQQTLETTSRMSNSSGARRRILMRSNSRLPSSYVMASNTVPGRTFGRN